MADINITADNINSKWKACNTLAKHGSFKWRYTNAQIQVKHDNGQFSLNKNIVECIVDYVNEKNCRIPLGARGDGNVPGDSLGAHLQQKNIQGFQRPYCSYLAAILVDEGMIDFENLGHGPGKGIWIYPSSNEGVTNSGIFDEAMLLTELHPLGENQQPQDYFQQIGKELVELGERISKTSMISSKSWEIDFTNISKDFIENVLKDIKKFEQNSIESLYIYKITTNDQANVDDIYEAYLTSKGRDANQKAYARVNTAHRGNSTLYVGSSKALTQRLKGHFGFGYPKTFSLQMSSWSTNLVGGVLVEVYCFNSETSQSVVQAIEDGYWSIFKPMFGRQGQK